MGTFRSDNNSGLCPEALEAIRDAAEGAATGYGDDEWTARAVEAFRTLFGAGTEVCFVATGTAANTPPLLRAVPPQRRRVHRPRAFHRLPPHHHRT